MNKVATTLGITVLLASIIVDINKQINKISLIKRDIVKISHVNN